MASEGTDLAALRRRYAREQKARREAEEIAERVTGDLYAASHALREVNRQLNATNEELQAVNHAMRDFVAVASHDLRGPLTAILGFASTMTEHWDTIPDADKRGFVSIISRQASQLNRMVDDLLTVSRIEAGALDTHVEAVRLRNATERVIEDFSQHASEIRVALPDGLAVLADPDHLQRILTNYVSNALKHGAPPVEVVAQAAGEWVEIRVRDSGEGVPEQFVPRLFGKFARANGGEGTGLGLSIVQGLARANGGETWYEPNRPRGSCFAVRLPKVAA